MKVLWMRVLCVAGIALAVFFLMSAYIGIENRLAAVSASLEEIRKAQVEHKQDLQIRQLEEGTHRLKTDQLFAAKMDRLLAEAKEAAKERREAQEALVKTVAEIAAAQKTEAGKADAEAAVARDRQAKLLERSAKQEAALLKRIETLEYPPMPKGEQPILEVAFTSTGLFKEKGEKGKIALFLKHKECHERPGSAQIKQIAALLNGLGAKVTDDILELKGLEEQEGRLIEGKDQDKCGVWYLVLRREKDDKAISFTHLEVFHSRLRVFWYTTLRERLKSPHVFRSRLTIR